MRLSAIVSEGGHFPPTPAVFWQPLFGDGHLAFTRPMALMIISVVFLVWFMVATTRNLSVVPSKRQFFVEQIYAIPRNAIGRDMIGEDKMRPFLPLLFTLFVTIFLNNFFAIVPLIQYPTMSRIGFPLVLALVVYFVYLGVGFKKHGFTGFFSRMIPAGVPPLIAPFLLVLESLTYFVVRPLTLALRLFANMFAGHMLLMVFILGGYAMLTSGQPFIQGLSVVGFGMGIIMTAFELLVQFLQAYVFTLLSASYIADALSDDH